ncbi:MAG: CinA family protein [Victivallales bacterium]|nr:CinA family protein [Victivallales bacterium]
MNPDLIESILDSGTKAVLVTTGGGSTALNALLTTPGASRFVVDARIPYSPEALADFLGEVPEQAVSPATARALAKVGQASSLSTVGVSCTASLQTDRARRGDDRAFICIKTAETEKLYALYFSKASRAEQEALLSDWLLVLILQAVGVERALMLSGSFNPVHQGHFNLLKVAEESIGFRGVFELSSANVDKSDIPEEEILRRVGEIRDIPVALTNAPRFTQKAELFPNTTFVLGHDTAERLIAYAKGDEWSFFQRLETSFLVAGRIFQGLEPTESDFSASRCKADLCFKTLENLKLPAGFEALFETIPESTFREDISSTDLRISAGSSL